MVLLQGLEPAASSGKQTRLSTLTPAPQVTEQGNAGDQLDQDAPKAMEGMQPEAGF